MGFSLISDENMRKLHKHGFDILVFIDKICKENNIKYFLCGGTLIGSIRHKGFIPWDDDIDIGMLRSDFEKFRECFISLHSDKYFLDCYETDNDYWLPFMKVRENNTILNEKCIQNKNVHKGIFVDIFPFDIVPDGGFDFNLKFKSFVIKQLMYSIIYKEGCRSINGFRRKKLTRFISMFPKKMLIDIQYRFMNKYNNKNYNHCICYVGTYNTIKEYIKISDIYPLKKGEFEGKKFYIPGNYDVYLTNLYGDYMKLPPKEKRRNHESVELNFEKGVSKIN